MSSPPLMQHSYQLLSGRVAALPVEHVALPLSLPLMPLLDIQGDGIPSVFPPEARTCITVAGPRHGKTVRVTHAVESWTEGGVLAVLEDCHSEDQSRWEAEGGIIVVWQAAAEQQGTQAQALTELVRTGQHVILIAHDPHMTILPDTYPPLTPLLTQVINLLAQPEAASSHARHAVLVDGVGHNLAQIDVYALLEAQIAAQQRGTQPVLLCLYSRTIDALLSASPDSTWRRLLGKTDVVAVHAVERQRLDPVHVPDVRPLSSAFVRLTQRGEWREVWWNRSGRA